MNEATMLEIKDHSEVIDKLSQTIQDNYVFPEVAKQIGKHLENKLTNGAYSEINDPKTLAEILTSHLQEINGDKHLRVWHKTEEFADGKEKTKQNSSVELQAEYDLSARLSNYGISKVELLKGNIGYIDIRQFYPPSVGADTAIASMAFISGSDALIFDLRKCLGGSPDMVSFFCSYLFEDREHLNDLYFRASNSTQQFWTLPYVPGKRYCDKPVYVLTSKCTFSGGEEFANDLKELKRAVIVGETTGGGAHPGRAIRFHKHLQVFVARGRAINPVSGKNWEGCGVEPDVIVDSENALTSAYKLALEEVLKTASKSEMLAHHSLREEVAEAIEGLQEQ